MRSSINQQQPNMRGRLISLDRLLTQDEMKSHIMLRVGKCHDLLRLIQLLKDEMTFIEKANSIRNMSAHTEEKNSATFMVAKLTRFIARINTSNGVLTVGMQEKNSEHFIIELNKLTDSYVLKNAEYIKMCALQNLFQLRQIKNRR